MNKINTGFSFVCKNNSYKININEETTNVVLFENIFQSEQRVIALFSKAIEQELLDKTLNFTKDTLMLFSTSKYGKVGLLFKPTKMPIGAKFQYKILISGILVFKEEKFAENEEYFKKAENKIEINDFLLPYFKKRNTNDPLEDSFNMSGMKVFLHVANNVLVKNEYFQKYNIRSFAESVIRKFLNEDMLELYLNYKMVHIKTCDELDKKEIVATISLCSKKMRNGSVAIEFFIDNFQKNFASEIISNAKKTQEDVISLDLVLKRKVQLDKPERKGLKIVSKKQHDEL